MRLSGTPACRPSTVFATGPDWAGQGGAELRGTWQRACGVGPRTATFPHSLLSHPPARRPPPRTGPAGPVLRLSPARDSTCFTTARRKNDVGFVDVLWEALVVVKECAAFICVDL